MEEFLLRLHGRFVRVLIEDERAPESAVPTLICRSAPSAEIVPLKLPDEERDDHEPEPPKGFPGMPQSLRVLLDEEPGPASLKIDVSALPAGTVPFTLEDFASQVASHLEAGSTEVRIDADTAQAWGCELTGA